MITRLTVSNYRSLGESVSVELGPFTALVGPNGSGKSNFVDALRFVADAMTIGLSGAISHRGGIGALRRWTGGPTYSLSIALEMLLDPGTPATYSFELRGDRADQYSVQQEHATVRNGANDLAFRVENGEWKLGPQGLRPQVDLKSLALPIIGGDARFQPLLTALQQIAVYTIFPDTLRSPQKYSPSTPMDQHGSNWASILKDQPESTWKPELVACLQRIAGDIEDIRVSEAAGYLVVEFRHLSPTGSPKWLAAAQESDGTLRVAGIVTGLLQEPPIPLLGVEEPELTVHPGVIPVLFDFLKQASRRSQVIMTTHSPELLDLMTDEEIRVVARHQGETTILPLSGDQRKTVRAGLLTLGDVLRTEGLQQELPLAAIG